MLAPRHARLCLSLCIPTFRRAAVLGELLESIAREVQGMPEEVEVVVSEDPSEESAATATMVERHRASLPGLRHETNAERLGFDRNFLRVMSLARGDWCWLLGDDDVMEPGGLARVLAALQAHPSVSGMTLGRHAYDARLEHQIYQRPFRQAATREFNDAGEMFLALLDQLGFLSCTVLQREIFERVAAEPATEGFIGSGYVQLWLLMRMMQVEPRWLALAEPCVGWRADNDSFNERGLLGRLRMDVEGLCAGQRRHLRRGFTGASPGDGLGRPDARAAPHRARQARRRFNRLRPDALALCLRHYARYPAWWLHTFPLLLFPASLLRARSHGRAGGETSPRR